LKVDQRTKEALQSLQRRGAKFAVMRELRLSGYALREAGTNGAAGPLDVVLISVGRGEPTQNNYYTPSFVRSLIEIVREGETRCFYDHPSASEDRDLPERSVLKLCGWFSNPRESVVDKRIAAVATFNPMRDDRVLGLLATAKSKAAKFPKALPFVAFSINAMGVGQVGTSPEDGSTVNLMEICTRVDSIDLVTSAGARGAPIFEAGRGRYTATCDSRFDVAFRSHTQPKKPIGHKPGYTR
jgi:hypothetical protein